ncbi:hypothetical protein LTR95_013835 [Oleoguttula sp. CCFEE 5521]
MYNLQLSALLVLLFSQSGIAADYSFWIVAISVKQTRSAHFDSNIATIILNGSGVSPYIYSRTLGDQGGGSPIIYYYPVDDLGFSFTADPATSTIELAYIIVNNSKGDKTNELVSALINAVAPIVSAATSILGITGIASSVQSLLGSFSNLRDGVVVADIPRFTRTQLQAVATVEYQSSKIYPGLPSPVGCSNNSDYVLAVYLKQISQSSLSLCNASCERNDHHISHFHRIQQHFDEVRRYVFGCEQHHVPGSSHKFHPSKDNYDLLSVCYNHLIISYGVEKLGYTYKQLELESKFV